MRRRLTFKKWRAHQRLVEREALQVLMRQSAPCCQNRKGIDVRVLQNPQLTKYVLLIGVLAALICGPGSVYGQTNLYIPPMRELMRDPAVDGSLPMESSAGTKTSPANLSGATSDTATMYYIKAVEEKIRKVPVSWPKDQLGNRIYGEVEIILTIGSDGALTNVATRGDQTLGSTVADMAKRAAPFFPPPPAILRGQTSIQFTRLLVFNQERAKPRGPQAPPPVYSGGPGPVTIIKR